MIEVDYKEEFRDFLLKGWGVLDIMSYTYPTQICSDGTCLRCRLARMLVEIEQIYGLTDDVRPRRVNAIPD